MTEILRGGSIVKMSAFIVWQFFFEKDPNGLTSCEKWEKSGFTGLTNDERVMLQGKRSSKIAFMKICRIIDHQQTEVVDLLESDGTPFILFDQGIARKAVKGVSFCGIIYSAPFFVRHFGASVILNLNNPDGDTVEFFWKLIRYLDGPEDPASLRPWLLQNFSKFVDVFDRFEQG